MYIHETAVIEKGAELGEKVKIGPYVHVENGARIGGGTEIMAHAVIRKGTHIGPECVVYHGAVLGGEPQDVKFQGEESYLKIGSKTVIREYVTAHRADGEGESTEIGSGCMLMANSHVAHNCRIGDGATLANLSTLGGFVQVGERAFLGGVVAIHQFVRIGAYVMLGGGSTVLADVPPYMMAAGGHRPPVVGLNTIGLTRAGFTPEARSLIKKAYRIIFKQGLRTRQAIEKLKNDLPATDEILNITNFLETTDRGISSGR